jgi:4,5-DOPA dioxygenase extradiol
MQRKIYVIFPGVIDLVFEHDGKYYILDWKSKAPFTADNHPTDEHLMPIFFAYGAASDTLKAERVHASVAHGFFANDSWLFH